MEISVRELIKILSLFRKDEYVHFKVVVNDEKVIDNNKISVAEIQCNLFPSYDDADQWLEITLSVDE